MHMVFLIYGLSFLGLGLAIAVQPHTESRFGLAGFIWLLAAFGIVHGALEWMELWTMMTGATSFLNAAKPVVLLVSYAFLVEFGRRILAESLPAGARSSVAGWVLDARIHVFLVGGIVLAASRSGEFLPAVVIWSRYLLGFPGSIMAGAGFLLYYRFRIRPVFPQGESVSMKYACRVSAFAFMAYAIFGGLVVPRSTWFPPDFLSQESFLEALGVPVQVFRAACAVLAAISVTHILLDLRIHDLAYPADSRNSRRAQ